MRRLFAALALVATTTPAAAELLWPLQQAPEDRALSSSFCEDRGSHLHGGVDMSTGGRVGVPVVAVADGAVVRVKVKYRGLGRAAYLQHDGGLMTVYGHLAGFAEPLRSRVDALIAERGLYPGDWFPEEPVPVKAGQVIAWSGKTGGGPPHLHFETRRDGGNRPVDPWAEGLPCAVDSVAPIVDALAVLPVHAGWTESVHALPLTEALELDGTELLRVRVADRFGAGTGFVRRLQLLLGDEELYRWDAADYSYAITRFAGHAFSRAAPRTAEAGAPGSWVWLASWPGGGLPFVTARTVHEAWRLGAPGDEVELVLVARDGCGNESRFPLRVRVTEREGSEGGDGLQLVRALSAVQSSDAGTDALGRPFGLGGGQWPAPPHATLEPGRSLRLTTAEGARLEIPPGANDARVGVVLSPFGPGPMLLRPEPPVPSPDAEGLILRARPVAAAPAALPLAAKATVAFAHAAGLEPRRLGVHRWNPATRAWQFWGDDVSSGSEIGTTTDRLGVFALFEDDFAPRVLSAARSTVTGEPWREDGERLVVRYVEHGEGLPWDGVRFRPEGSQEEWIGVHDPDEAEAEFVLPPGRAGRPLRGTLVLEDRAGHRAEQAVDLAP